MTGLYPNPCFNEVCYKGTALYLQDPKVPNMYTMDCLLAFRSLSYQGSQYTLFYLINMCIIYFYIQCHRFRKTKFLSVEL